MNPLLVKDIVELGVTVVICIIFLTQQQRMFGYLEKMISTMAKLEKQLNKDYLKGKGLEIFNQNLKEYEVIKENK